MNVTSNWRNKDGSFEKEYPVCDLCGCLTEVYARLPVSDGYLRICKGCLTEAIKSIDEHYINHMKRNISHHSSNG